MRKLILTISLITAVIVTFLLPQLAFADSNDSVTVKLTVADTVTTTIIYSYDDLNRLETASDNTTSTAYTYDETGNIMNRTTN